MALTALATANTTIGPSQYADMAQALAPRFLVDTPTALQPSYSSGTVTLQPGACLIAGTRVRATSTESVAVPSVSSGTKTYTIVIRVDWAKGTDAASVVCLPTTTVNNSTSPNTAYINRIPGVLYDAVVATVTRQAGYTKATSFTDYRAWGGDGGPLRVSDAALLYPTMLDARIGTFISTDKGLYTKRLDNDGVWRAVGTDSNPWRVWTPTLRYYNKDVPNGTSGGTVASLGNGGTYSARYRIVDGMLDGYVYISPGSTGANLGDGGITMDLPIACANWQEDTWSMGHLYTTTSYGGDRNIDWHLEMLVKKGWTRGYLFTNVSGEYSDLQPYQSANAFTLGPGTGVPKVVGGYPVGPITMHVNYPVDV
jgi:hypothetical protein